MSKRILHRWSMMLLLVSAASACEEIDGIVGGLTDAVSVESGCWSVAYSGVSSGNIGCGVLPGLGDFEIDRQFIEEVRIQSTFWSGIPARVHVFDECPGIQNALALPSGDILFGRNMFWQRVAQTGSTLPGAAVLAHEWAHQIQFRFGWMDPQAPTARTQELEADAFAGFYMALAKSWAWNQLGSFYNTLYSLGDYQFNHPNHHGTPNERVAAGELGFTTAIHAAQSGVSYGYEDLHRIFRGAVSAIMSGEAAYEGLPTVPDDRTRSGGVSLGDFIVTHREAVPFHLLAPLSQDQRQRAYPARRDGTFN